MKNRAQNSPDEMKKSHNRTGWHPHLYRWSEKTNQWMPYLGFDDDIQILTECINSMRQHIEINAVRTGWDYNSNTLMRFFDEKKLVVDASA